MLRIHFTSADLTRIRVEPAASVFGETALSLHLLSSRAGLTGWRRHVAPRVPAAVITALLPTGSITPASLLSTTQESDSHDSDGVLGVPRKQVYADLTQRVRRRPVPSCWRLTADTDPAGAGLAGDTLHAYHQAAVAPYWPEIQAAVDGARASYARRLVDGGLHALLACLHPGIGWDGAHTLAIGPVEAGQAGAGQAGAGQGGDVHLDGRGLTILPSVFCRHPLVFADPGGDPVLVSPVQDGDRVLDAPQAPTAGALAALIGRTRAAALAVAAEGGCTTSELARRIGVTKGAASQHTTVLREGGLINSHRNGRHMHHTITPLGALLLDRHTARCTSKS